MMKISKVVCFLVLKKEKIEKLKAIIRNVCRPIYTAALLL